MWTFQYKHGDRPLDGYTIQRAAGRGGFGEVYYAISDAGREVALKVVTGYEQIELRGISQCMNLKSPHLVTIFDVKHNAEGKPFVLMEFVSGPNLRQLLDENPSGLGEQKAAFFLREIGKGLTYLHGCGIVHRDLKPANIFYENGYVKIGDYGLSKSITTSQHSGQTVTVGTVHYMAPEVGAGKYDQGIDIYALGAVLYEMITGVPPYVGASPSEILLKHLSSVPDCSGISEPFATAIKRAMARNPDDRYKNVQEMVEAVFGAEHIQQSVSVFSPEELSVVAGRVAQNVAGSVKPSSGPAAQTQTASAPEPSDPWERMAWKFEQAGQRIADHAERFGQNVTDRFSGRPGSKNQLNNPAIDPSRDFTVPVEDRLPRQSRILLGIIAGLVVSIAAGVMSRQNNGEIAVVVAASIFGAVGALMLVRYRIGPHIEREAPGLQRLLLNGSAVAGMLLMGGIISGGFNSRLARTETWPAAALPIVILGISRWLRPDRPERVRVSHAVAAAGLAFVVCLMFKGNPQIAVSIAAGTALVAQVIAPWDPRRGIYTNNAQPNAQTQPMRVYGNVNVDQNEAEAMRAAGVKVYGNMNVRDGSPAAVPVAIASPGSTWAPLRTVPTAIRYVWIGLFALASSLGIAFAVAAGMVRRDGDAPPLMGLAIGFGGLGVMGLIRYFARNYFGIWNYLLRPLVVLAALTTSVTCLMFLSLTRMASAEVTVAVFLTAFPFLVMIVALFVPGKRYNQVAAATGSKPPPLPSQQKPLDSSLGISPFKRLWALLLSGIGFFGACGIQRFYVGKIGTGVIWLLTGGLFGIGQIVDVIMILSGSFTDRHGRRLVIWEDEFELGPEGANSRIAAAAADSARPRPQMSTGELLSWHAHGLLSALAGLLIFASSMAALGLAMHLPDAIAAGVFDTRLANEIQAELFNGDPSWPSMMKHIGGLLAAIAFVTGVGAMVFARRRSGASHMLRGCLAAFLLVLSIKPISEIVKSTINWEPIALKAQADQIPAAIDGFIAACRPEMVVASGVILLCAAVMFAWPGRRPWDAAPQPKAVQP